MTTLMFWTLFICILNGWSQLFDVTHPFSNSPFYIHSFPVECWPPLPCFLPPAPYPHHRLQCHLQRWWFTEPPVWPHQSNSILGQMPDHPTPIYHSGCTPRHSNKCLAQTSPTSSPLLTYSKSEVDLLQNHSLGTLLYAASSLHFPTQAFTGCLTSHLHLVVPQCYNDISLGIVALSSLIGQQR